MSDTAGSSICESLNVWPVRLTAGGVHGWSLWFSGETDVLLARGGRIPLFASPEALLAAVSTTPEAFTLQGAPRLGSVELRQVLDAHAASLDLDAAAEWFARPEREADMAACERALNAINMATDIGATTGDDRISALITSDALVGAFDALTFGQTLLGDGSPFRDNPVAMTSAITPDAAALAVRLLTLAGHHLEAA